MRNRSAKKGKGKILVVLVLIVLGLIVGAGYVYTAPEFEREVPTVYSEQNVFWNRTDPLKVRLAANEGLRSFELILSDGKNSLIVGQGIL